MESRIRAASDEVEQLDEALTIARERLGGIVVEAIEGGAHQRAVARWAGRSQSWVHAVIASH